tara:strand:+ start:24 stop:725 length:702 start_codon:yes stop_codon:yes gene_type:complete
MYIYLLFLWTFGYVSLVVHQNIYFSDSNISNSHIKPIYFSCRLATNIGSISLLLHQMSSYNDLKNVPMEYIYFLYIFFISLVYHFGFYVQYLLNSQSSILNKFGSSLLPMLLAVTWCYSNIPEATAVLTILSGGGWIYTLLSTSDCSTGMCYSNRHITTPHGILSYPFHFYQLLTILVAWCILLVECHHSEFFTIWTLKVLMASQTIDVVGLTWILSRTSPPFLSNNIEYENL